jgi:hypothetical protein
MRKFWIVGRMVGERLSLCVKPTEHKTKEGAYEEAQSWKYGSHVIFEAVGIVHGTKNQQVIPDIQQGENEI